MTSMQRFTSGRNDPHRGPAAVTAAGARGEADPRRAWLALAAVCLGVTMTFVNVTATFAALGAIQAGLHTSTTTLVWVASAYTLAVAGLVLSAGTLGDLAGRRTVFLAGVVVLGAGSLVAFAAASPAILITGEAVMGVGAAMVLPTSLTIVSRSFPDPRRRTEAISIWAGVAGIGLAAGPLIAGVLLNHFSWHAVFLVNAGIAAADLIITPFLVGNSRQPGRRLDLPGLLIGTLSVVALTYAVIQGGHTGYLSGPILAAFAVFLVTLAIFVVAELRSGDPMLDLTLFRSASFSTVMTVATIANAAFGGIALIMVLYFERVQHASALDTGWRLLPTLAVYVAVSAVAGRLVRRAGFRTLLGAGLVIAAAGALALLASPPGTSYARVWPGMVLFGLGEGLVLAPATAAAVASVAYEQAGMASAAVNMFRQVGIVLGTSVLGTVLATRFAAQLPGRLAAAGVPHQIAAQAAATASGASTAAVPGGTAGRAILASVSGALTDADHLGLVIAACALAAAAALAVTVLRANTGTPVPAQAGAGKEASAAAGKPAIPIRKDVVSQPGPEAAGPQSAR